MKLGYIFNIEFFYKRIGLKNQINLKYKDNCILSLVIFYK
jgi:hypothetical protein